MENTAAGMAIGDPEAATDADTGDTLTYSLGGTHAASFAIVGTSGQLQTMAAVDYDTKTSYMVTVMVTDDGTPAMTASIDVTMNVTNDTTDDPVTNSPPTLSITTTEPTDAVTAGSFDIVYLAMDADTADTVTVSAAIASDAVLLRQ